MRAGDLRHVVQLQQRDALQDGYGQQARTWTTLTTLYVDIQPLSGVQLERARSIYNETSHEVHVRFQPMLADIRQVGSYRLLFGSRIFDIGGSMNLGERNREVVLLCKEGLNDGQ